MCLRRFGVVQAILLAFTSSKTSGFTVALGQVPWTLLNPVSPWQIPLEQHSTCAAVWAFEIPLRKFWWCSEIGFVMHLILCNCRLPLSRSFPLQQSHVCFAPLALDPEVIVQWARSAGCSGWKPDLQYKLNSFQSALWLHRHSRAESDGNAWGWWESRSSHHQVLIRAGRNAGKASPLIAGHMYPFWDNSKLKCPFNGLCTLESD